MKSRKQALVLAEQESSSGKNVSDQYLKRFVSAYEKKLPLPRKKPGLPIMIGVVGLVGSGKTSVVKILSSKLSLLRISTDEIRAALQKKGYNTLRTKEIATMLVDKYSTQGYSMALDGDSISLASRKFLKSYSAKHKIKLILIHIKTPEKYIIAKLTKYRPSFLPHYYRRKPLHLHYLKTINFFYTFDISKPNLSKQVDTFLTKLQKGKK